MYNRNRQDYRQDYCPYADNNSRQNSNFPCQYCDRMQMNNYNYQNQYSDMYYPSYETEQMCPIRLKDYGPEPFVVNIHEAAKQNDNFRIALWTGEHLQLTLMSIPVGGEIGLEIHPEVDQFLRIEEGMGLVKMGKSQNNLDFRRNVSDDSAILIPAGTWHNLINTGDIPIKLYSIYAPPQHPHGTVHATKEEAEAAENH